MLHVSNSNDLVKTIMEETAKKTEKVILQGLEDLVSRGLLVVRYDQPQLVETYDPTSPNGKRFTVNTAVRLELKDQGYIQKLELENKELREAIDRMFAVVGK